MFFEMVRIALWVTLAKIAFLISEKKDEPILAAPSDVLKQNG